MTKRPLILLLLSVLLQSGMVIAQSKWVKKGDACMEKGDVPGAIERYEWAVKQGSHQEAMSRLAQSYRKLNNYDEALKWARRASFHPEANPEDYFLLGQAYMSIEEYDSAAIQFEKFRKESPSQGRVSDFLEACAAYERLLADTSQYRIQPVSFNSKRSDFSPAFWKDSLIFASARDRDIGVIYTSSFTDKPLLDLFYTSPGKKDRWRKPKPLPGNLNSKFNEGPLVLLPGDTVMYFTRNELGKGTQKGISKLDLYQARLVKGAWTDPIPLSLNGEGFSTGHPAISPDGKTLVFASNRPGGIGNTDLYAVEVLADGNFGTPKNLGPEVNTQGDEMFPFFHPGGTLYFSSDGQFGLGDLDVFSAVPIGSSWTRVRNVGAPINSSRDDFGFILASDQKSGFVSSNREAKDEFDDNIYSFSVLRPDFECEPMAYPDYCPTFFEKGTMNLDSLPFIYEWDLGDGTTKRGLEAEHCYDGPGVYQVKLNVIDTTSGFLFYTEAEFQFEIKAISQVTIEGPEFGETQTPIAFSGGKSEVDGCEIQEYYWDFSDGARYKGKEVNHTFSSPGDYEVLLGIIGYDAENNSECKQCRSKIIRVREGQSFIELKDSIKKAEALAEIKLKGVKAKPFRPNYDPQVRKSDGDLGGARILDFDPDETWELEPKFESNQLLNESYSVKIATSDEKIPTDPENFQGLEEVREVKQEGKYNYLIGDEPNIESLYPLYSEVVSLGYDQAIVIAHFQDSILSLPDSSLILSIPGIDKPILVSVLEGRITDFNGNPLNGEIKVEDLLNGEVFSSTRSDDDGKFYIELPNGRIYSFFANIEGFIPVSENIDLRDMDRQIRFSGNIKAISVDDMVNTGAVVRINNIFFDFDKATLRPESFVELDRLALILQENKHLKVQIRAHTDDFGSEKYNLQLSNRRAAAVRRYLALSFGIEDITSKGFGESNPQVPNDTPENRQINRRVEFKLLKN